MDVLEKDKPNVEDREIINLSVFEIDSHYYARTQMDQERIKFFKLLLSKKEKLSPIKVCFYNNAWICLDGHMTLQAYKDSNILYIDCEIVKDIQPDYFVLYSAKFNLFSSKPLSQEELTKVIYESRFVKNIPVNEICDFLGLGRSFVFKILKPYNKAKLQETINKAIELYNDENFKNIDDIAKCLGREPKTISRWINTYNNPVSEDKKLFESLKTNSSLIFIDKELNTFLCMQLIKKNMDSKDICNLLHMHSRDVFMIGYIILYCYQNIDCSVDDIVQYFGCKNIEQLTMIHFMRVYFLNLLVDRKQLFDWLETHCDLHDEIYRKIVHIEMLHNITVENESNIVEKKVKNKTNKIKDDYSEGKIDQIDVLNPKQLALVVDNFKKIEDEFVINKKEINSEEAKKILEQLNRLMTMMNSIMPLLVKSINFK